MHLLPEYALTSRNTIHHTDLFRLCRAQAASSIDMILCDLPYGVTNAKWDSIIDMPTMWNEFKRIIKPRAAIVLTATNPFAAMLIMSNFEMFRYEWVWTKTYGTDFLNAARKPIRAHEQVLVFGRSLLYNPQMRTGKPYSATRGGNPKIIRDDKLLRVSGANHGTRYPLSYIKFANETGLHPTQKPVALFEYLIRTYTQSGGVVLDPCSGSGTTAIAAIKTGRDYICGDSSPEYVEMSRHRVQASDPFQHTELKDGSKQLSMFAG